MSYLYGDSTPSTLEINYIEFLRDVVEFSVQVLLADQRIVQGRMRVRSLDHTTAAEIERLQRLEVTVAKALEGMTSGGDVSSARCAAAIVRASAEIVRAEVAAVQSTLAAEAGKRDAQVTEERRAGIRALEALLARHDLPGMTLDLHVGVQGGGRYACRALMETGFGLGAVLDLEIPANDLYGQVFRAERLAERLEVQAPEMSGWLHKEMKVRLQHLEKHFLTEVSIVGGSGTFELRVAPDGSGSGMNVKVASDGPRPVLLSRIDEQGEEMGTPFEAREGDVGKLVAFYQKVTAPLRDLTRHGKRVVEVTFDGEPIEKLDSPSMLVERLVATIAPVVQEIAARSRSSDELVLRRLIGDDRREEIFLSKEELRRKLEPLVEGRRALFDPLWLDGGKVAPAPAVPVPVPVPVPETKAPGAPEASHEPPPVGRAGAVLAPRALGVPVDRVTPRAGSLVVGEVRLPSAVAAPAARLPVAVAPRVELARPRTGTPLLGSPAADSGPAAAPGAPGAARAADPIRRPLGSPALGTRTQTPAAEPARSPLLGRGLGTPPLGSAKPAAEAVPAPQAADAPSDEAATPPPERTDAKDPATGD
jgi:hypothetical protein